MSVPLPSQIPSPEPSISTAVDLGFLSVRTAMRAPGSSKDYSVYEFDLDEAEAGVEVESGKIARKLSMLAGAEKCDPSPLSRRHFLSTFTEGSHQQPGTKSVLYVDTDGSNDSHKSNSYATQSIKSSQGEFVSADGPSGMADLLDSTNNVGHEQICELNFGGEASIRGLSRLDSLGKRISSLGSPSFDRKQLNCSLLELQSFKQQVDVISDDDQSLTPSYSPVSASDIEVNEDAIEDQTSDVCSDDYVDMEMKMDMEVSLVPDYIAYGDNCFAQSQLHFCSDCIKLEVFDIESDEYLHLDWTVNDLVYIRCQFLAGIAQVMLILRQTATRAENSESVSGIVKLEFAVSDPHWFEVERRITMLAMKYKAVWNVLSDDMAVVLDDIVGQNGVSNLPQYFSGLDESSEDVVYPKGDPDAVTISKRDVKLLEPETFINDTIIDFYIKYLKDKIPLEEKHKFHFFNSFFFRKLADLDKDPESILEGRAAFLRVRKWTRKVNIFEKEYIFIPVNYNLHWSLIVICNPGEIANFRDGDKKRASKVPCILHMDSIKGCHRRVKTLVQSYLSEEWKERFGDLSEELSHNFACLRFVSLELPQQENSFDCGLFLLHYVELFLEEAPIDFNPFRITKFTNFLNKEWFPPAEASNKRFAIRELMCEILENHTKAASVNDSQQVDAGKEKADAFLPDKNSRDMASLSLNCSDENGTENKLTVSTSAVMLRCEKELTSEMDALCAQTVSTGYASNSHIELFQEVRSHPMLNSLVAPNEEDGRPNELGQHENIRCQSLDGLSCTTSHSPMDSGPHDALCLKDTPLKSKGNQENDPACGQSGFVSSTSDEEKADEHCKHPPKMNSGHHSMRKARSASPRTDDSVAEIPASTSPEREMDCRVEDCHDDCSAKMEAVTPTEGNRETNICQQNDLTENQGTETTEAKNIKGTGEGGWCIDDSAAKPSEGGGTHKRMKRTEDWR